jgi:hypothetical protein
LEFGLVNGEIGQHLSVFCACGVIATDPTLVRAVHHVGGHVCEVHTDIHCPVWV